MYSNRPEQQAPAEIIYGVDEAKKYQLSSRMVSIQTELTNRALEILAIPPGRPRLLLDIGCGTGLSGAVLSNNDHLWVGTDISKAMLDVGADRELPGDFVHSDMGHGFGYRPGMFDGAVSISALQWLCTAEKSC